MGAGALSRAERASTGSDLAETASSDAVSLTTAKQTAGYSQPEPVEGDTHVRSKELRVRN